MRRLVVLLGVVAFNTYFVCAQSGTDTFTLNQYQEMIGNAYKAIDAHNWNAAIKQLDTLVKLNPVNGELWYKLGESYYYSGDFDKAIDYFKKSLEAGDPAPFETACYIARCYAKQHNKINVLNWLRQSFNLGYRNLAAIQKDSSFKDYFNDNGFKEIVGIPLQQFKTREEGWRFDLALMVREVKRRGPKPFRYISERKFDSTVAILNKKISVLTDLQMILEFEKILVLVGDGHTMIYAFYERPEFQKNLPLDFHFFEEGLFITEADRRYGDLLGCQVIAFDDKSTGEIIKGVDPIINRDNEIGPKILGLMRMRTIPLLFGLALVKSPDEITLTVKDGKGRIKKVNVKADCPVSTRSLWDQLPDTWLTYDQHEKKEPPLYRQNVFAHYWFHYFKSNATVYFQYNRMSNDTQNSFYHFCDSLFAFINTNNVDKLIIDVRWNNGGNTLLAPYLLNKLIACIKINQKGKLFAIIGGRSYSATINLLGYLERLTPIIFVGTPTGSSPNFIGEDNPFELPYSKLMANVSDQFWQNSWPFDYRKWFAPFMYIPTTFRDFVSCKDAALDVILNYKNE